MIALRLPVKNVLPHFAAYQEIPVALVPGAAAAGMSCA